MNKIVEEFIKKRKEQGIDRHRTNFSKELRKMRGDKGKPRDIYIDRLPTKYKSYLQRANRKKLSFELSVEQFNQFINDYCVYCGSGANGIDRIDSGEGYTIDNCVSCCSKCNMMKYIYSVDVFLNHVDKITNHQQKRRDSQQVS